MRVLFVGFLRIGEDNQTARTLKNLFTDIKDVEIMQYCLNPRLRKIHNPYPTVYLTKKESFITHYMFERHGGMNTDTSAKAFSDKGGFKAKLRKSVAELASKIRDNSNIRISKETYAAIDEFKPELIYTLAGNISDTRVSVALSKRYNIPIVAHIMDDLIERRYNGKGLFIRHLDKKFKKSTKEMYAHSVLGIAIGEKMAREYKAKFNLPFHHAMNCLDSLHYTAKNVGDPLTLIFSGGVHGGRDATLKKLSSFIDSYNNTDGKRKIRLEIYTNPAGVKQLGDISSDSVFVNNYVPIDELFNNLSRADMLLHVESFEESDKKYFRLSMSTKLPEYLSVGRPVMVIGPTDMSSLEYVEEKGVGYSFHDLDGLCDFFNSLTDSELLEKDKRALAVATEEHLRINVQNRLKDAFALSISQYDKKLKEENEK